MNTNVAIVKGKEFFVNLTQLIFALSFPLVLYPKNICDGVIFSIFTPS